MDRVIHITHLELELTILLICCVISMYLQEHTQFGKKLSFERQTLNDVN